MKDDNSAAKTQEGGEHTHPVCVIGPSIERGHDHYCEIVDEWCEVDECISHYARTGSYQTLQTEDDLPWTTTP